MTRRTIKRLLTAKAPAICIGIALSLVLAVGGWGGYRDLRSVRHAVIQSEVSRTRSHAERSVGRIETQLVEAGYPSDLAKASHSSWMRNHWERTITPPAQLYGAIVSTDGVILSHSDPRQEGKTLSFDSRIVNLLDFGPGVCETTNSQLGDGRRVVDISVPINHNNSKVGEFHTGIDADWLDKRITTALVDTVNGWTVVIGAILVVVFLSSLSLYRITRQTARLEAALELSDARRVNEVSQLVVGMAHEVRNPLNAVRLNLYTAEHVFQGDVQLDRNEVNVMLSESVREIERVEEMIQQLLGYARVDPHEPEVFDFAAEIQSALQFLKHSLDQARISICLTHPPEALYVQMDRSRLRQILLNLIKNACEAIGEEGRVEIKVRKTGESVEVTIYDSGPGVPTILRERIFDPFFTTKDSGTGLGLAVVRSLVEAAGGSIRCEPMEGTGTSFRLSFPLAPAARQEFA